VSNVTSYSQFSENGCPLPPEYHPDW